MERRQSILFQSSQRVVVEDYAHHPTEVRAAIAGARELYPDRRIVVAFQPHTYTRTKALFDEFAKALGKADDVLVLPIYAAREKNESGVSSRELAVKTLEYNSSARYVASHEAAVDDLCKQLTNNDVLLVMGAGTVIEVTKQLVG